jgi:hypothetical protein
LYLFLFWLHGHVLFVLFCFPEIWKWTPNVFRYCTAIQRPWMAGMWCNESIIFKYTSVYSHVVLA